MKAADPTSSVIPGLHRQGGDAYGEIDERKDLLMSVSIRINLFGYRITLTITKKAAKAMN